MKQRNKLYITYHSFDRAFRIKLRNRLLQKILQPDNKAKFYNWLYDTSQPNIFEKRIINNVFGEKIY
jgi:hypothetical protein